MNSLALTTVEASQSGKPVTVVVTDRLLARILLLLVSKYLADWRLIMKRALYAVILLALLGATAACNTIRGFGRDVERAGEQTQDTAESVRRRM